MKNYILYHAGCRDGFCAAWCARRALDEENCIFIPVQHGEPPPEIPEGNKIYILDFCYPQAVLEAMAANSQGVFVLDHHRTAFDLVPKLLSDNRSAYVICPRSERRAAWAPVAFAGRLQVYVEQGKSGGRLAWEYFRDGQELGKLEAPWLVDYTEDRDLWQWKLPNSQEVSAFLQSWPDDFERWDAWDRDLLPDDRSGSGYSDTHRRHDNWRTVVAEGAAILRYQKGIVESAAGFARLATIGGHRVPCVNTTVLHSEIGQRLAELEVCQCQCHEQQMNCCTDCADGKMGTKAKFGATWFQRSDSLFVYSLRSIGDFDVSEIAKQYVGGGHKNAAGFQVEWKYHLLIQGIIRLGEVTEWSRRHATSG